MKQACFTNLVILISEDIPMVLLNGWVIFYLKDFEFYTLCALLTTFLFMGFRISIIMNFSMHQLHYDQLKLHIMKKNQKKFIKGIQNNLALAT